MGFEFTNNLIDYFLSPKKTGYDVPKTLAYSMVLIIAVYLIYKALKKLNVKIDKRLAVAVAPYVIFAGALRVLQDANVVNSYFFITPGIYIFVFAVTFCVLLLSVALQKKFSIPYYKTVFVLGLLLLPFTLAQLSFSNFYGGLLIFLFLAPWALFFKLPIKIPFKFRFKISGWALENKIVTLVHLFDATTTAVSLGFFGYYEQHVLPTFFINVFGPFSFVLLKAVAIVSILVLIDRLSGDSEFNNYLKLVIGLLGAGTGSRDFISLLARI